MTTLKNYLDSKMVENIQHYQQLQLKALRKFIRESLGDDGYPYPEDEMKDWKVCPFKSDGHLVSLFNDEQVGAQVTFIDPKGIIHQGRIRYKNL